MTRAKTQHGAPKRAATQGGAKKRAPSQGVPFEELDAAIDALGADDEAPPPPRPVRRGPPTPPPPKRSSTTAAPPPSAGRPGLPRAVSTAGALAPPRAASRAGGHAAENPLARAAGKTSPPPTRETPSPQVRAAERSLPKAPFADKAPPRPSPGSRVNEGKLDLGSPIRTGRRLDSDDFADMAAADSADGKVRKRFDHDAAAGVHDAAAGVSHDSSGVSPISDDDFVVEVESLAEVRSISIAIFDDPPAIAAAKHAIAVAGHKVVAAATGATGIEQIKTLLRSGSADALLVGVPGGEELIETALALGAKRPVVIAVSAGSAVEAVRRAANVGADLAIARPIDAEKLAPVMFAAGRIGKGHNDAPAAAQPAIKARLDALAEPEPGALQPFELFQRVLELELKRSKRYDYPVAVALFSVEIDPPEPPPGMRGILRARAGNALIQSIRDIDMATEIDQERFFVLLPYTTLAGAAQVARRIINAVTGLPPVTAAGRTIPPKIVGSVAGVLSGQATSFARLMRDATQALEQARRDGAELAVPLVRAAPGAE